MYSIYRKLAEYFANKAYGKFFDSFIVVKLPNGDYTCLYSRKDLIESLSGREYELKVLNRKK